MGVGEGTAVAVWVMVGLGEGTAVDVNRKPSTSGWQAISKMIKVNVVPKLNFCPVYLIVTQPRLPEHFDTLLLFYVQRTEPT
jgi:hypothetical protein